MRITNQNNQSQTKERSFVVAKVVLMMMKLHAQTKK
jgi:hypothetical protein